MAVKFNPFTGQLQIDEKGSGGGSSVIEGEVDTYNDLPLDGSAALNSSWLVRTASGSWFTGGSKPAGIYVRVNTAGSSRDNDYVYAGLLPSAFSDSEFTLYDDAAPTKLAKFQLSGISASTTRTISVPDKNITLDDAGDARTPTSHTHSASAITSGTIDTARLGSGTANSGTYLRGDQTWAAVGSGGSTNIWIAASQFIPRTTTGCGVDSRETSTNRQNFDELLFDAGTDEFAQALVEMPSNYNNGTITARFYWTASSGSGSVIWGIQGRAFADDDALDTAAGTAQTVTDTLLAANDMHVSSATSAVTIGGTPAANTPIQFQIYRDADAAGDTLAVDARLLGVEIIYTAA